MVLSEKLAALRKEHGYSQLYVAERLNVSRQAISRWEVGSSVPSTENLLELSRLYGVPLDELVGRDAESPTQVTPEREAVHEEPVPHQQKIDMVHIPKEKFFLGCAVVFLAFLCLLVASLWNASKVQKDDDGYDTIRYEDMFDGGTPSPDGTFEFE